VVIQGIEGLQWVAVKQVDLVAFHLPLVRRGRRVVRPLTGLRKRDTCPVCAGGYAGPGLSSPAPTPLAPPRVVAPARARPPPPRPTPRPFPGLAPARRPRPPRPGAALFTVSPTELGFTPLILLRAAAASAPPLLLSWRWRWRWRAVLQVQVTVCRVQVLSDRRG
jgi:hypothetical protein